MANDLNRSIKIYIDNADANKKADELRNKVEALNTELEQLAATNGKDSDEYKKKKKAYEDAQKSLNIYTNKLQETERVLRNLSGATYEELIKAKKGLLKVLKQAQRGSEEYNSTLLLLTRTEEQLAEVQREMGGATGRQGSSFGRMADNFNKYFGVITAGIATITGLSFTFRKLAEDMAHMDDVYADVMKTTGMAKDEVLELNKSLKQIDTRTAREELNKIAEEGGRIGIPKEEILAFVKAMDVANVALGDSFKGGASEIANTLGKLKFLFEDTKNLEVDKAYLSIASAINELGANGVASELNIANFATRIGSMPAALKPASHEALALGAAFEESGIEAEIASRAYNIVLSRASTNTEKFAKVMGKSTEEVKALINANPLEFFLQFSEQMKGMNATDTANTLNELKINADGANKAIGAAANNTDRFRELQEMANTAFTEGNSVLDEFNIRNNTLAARLDKAKKAFTETSLELGEKLNPILLKSVNSTTYLIKALVELPKWLAKNKGEIIIITAAILGYTIAVNASRLALMAKNVILKLNTGLTVANRIATLALAAAQALLAGNATRARKAMSLLNQAISSKNIYVAIAIAIAAVSVAIYKMVTAISKAEQAMRDFDQQTAEEEFSANRAFEAIKKTNIGTEERRVLIEKLNSRYGEYLDNLLSDTASNEELAAAQRKVIDNIREKIALETRDKAIAESAKDGLKEQRELLKDITKILTDKVGEDAADIYAKKIAEAFNNAGSFTHKALTQSLKELENVGVTYGDFMTGWGPWQGNYLDKYGESITSMKQEIISIEKEFDRILSKKPQKATPPASTTTTNPEENPASDSTPPSAPNDAAKKLAEQQADERRKILENTQVLVDIETKNYNDRLKEAGIFGLEMNKLTEAQLAQRLQLDNDYQKALTDIAVKAEEERYNNAKKSAGISVGADVAPSESGLSGEQLAAYEILYKQHLANVQKIKDDADKKAADSQKSANAVILSLMQEGNKAEVDALNSIAKARKIALNEEYASGKISSQQYNDELDKIESDAMQERIDLQIRYIETLKGLPNPTEEQLKELQAAQSALLDLTLQSQGDVLKTEEDFEKKRRDIRMQYGIASLQEQHDAEMEVLRQQYADKLITEDDFEQAKLQLKLKYAQQYAQQAEQFVSTAANAVQSLEKAQTAKVGAEYSKRQSALTEQYNQGLISQEEYNSQKEQLDYEQRAKELEIQKKYADANFGLQVAQIVASTAVSAMQAYSAMAGIPIVGPALGAIAAAAAVVAGAAQISAAKAERDRIKSLTLEAPGGGGGSKSTAKYVSKSEASAVPQAAEGRYDVIGEDDGRLYSNVPLVGEPVTGIVAKPTLISEQGSELIVSAPDLKRLQKHVNYPLVLSAISDARSNTVPQRAAGNYNAVAKDAGTLQTAIPNMDAFINAVQRFGETVNDLRQHPLQAKMNFFEFEDASRTVTGTRDFGKSPEK